MSPEAAAALLRAQADAVLAAGEPVALTISVRSLDAQPRSSHSAGSSAGPLSAAERARNYRSRRHARHAERDENVTNVTKNVTPAVTGDLEGALISEKVIQAETSGKETGIQEFKLTGQDQETPKTALSVTNVTAITSRDAVTRDVTQVFTVWRDLYSPRSRLDAKRERRIRAHLTTGGFSAEELIGAIRNAQNDPFLMGQNDTGRQYLGIETLLRDAAQVERLRDLTEPLRPRSAPVRNSGSEMTERAHRIAAEERAAAAKNGARPALALLSEFPR